MTDDIVAIKEKLEKLEEVIFWAAKFEPDVNTLQKLEERDLAAEEKIVGNRDLANLLISELDKGNLEVVAMKFSRNSDLDSEKFAQFVDFYLQERYFEAVESVRSLEKTAKHLDQIQKTKFDDKKKNLYLISERLERIDRDKLRKSKERASQVMAVLDQVDRIDGNIGERIGLGTDMDENPGQLAKKTRILEETYEEILERCENFLNRPREEIIEIGRELRKKEKI